eukprot:CAMPEP_0119552140 /NCGR_PEP_ID=MMETSP1352-20130426/5219_1 /TAXON_ID=265584 /ORGANISM="Stauroneis constricta, Strain CCMP1120" /LENGTH=770 /DNA_ID=CAMNT_0007598323 /DNA_START=316 /DNA_END=2628 /DNA_ORIENTATION=+
MAAATTTPAAPGSSSIRIEEPPVLSSVFAYGSETQVPNHDICRLSYYLKCCTMGCGMLHFLPPALSAAASDGDRSSTSTASSPLIEYQNAHRLPVEQQQMIIKIAFQDFPLVTLLNRVIILDDQHLLLPQGTLNTFYEFGTAAGYFTIYPYTATASTRYDLVKVMLCTTRWIQEYYLNPFLRYVHGELLIETFAVRIYPEDLAVAGTATTTNAPTASDYDDNDGNTDTETVTRNQAMTPATASRRRRAPSSSSLPSRRHRRDAGPDADASDENLDENRRFHPTTEIGGALADVNNGSITDTGRGRVGENERNVDVRANININRNISNDGCTNNDAMITAGSNTTTTNNTAANNCNSRSDDDGDGTVDTMMFDADEHNNVSRDGATRNANCANRIVRDLAADVNNMNVNVAAAAGQGSSGGCIHGAVAARSLSTATAPRDSAGTDDNNNARQSALENISSLQLPIDLLAASIAGLRRPLTQLDQLLIDGISRSAVGNRRDHCPRVNANANSGNDNGNSNNGGNDNASSVLPNGQDRKKPPTHVAADCRGIHSGIRCDSCLQHEIIGPRYSCLQCHGFDQCETCYKSTHHDQTHAFVRIQYERSVKEVLPPRIIKLNDPAVRRLRQNKRRRRPSASSASMRRWCKKRRSSRPSGLGLTDPVSSRRSCSCSRSCGAASLPASTAASSLQSTTSHHRSEECQQQAPPELSRRYSSSSITSTNSAATCSSTASTFSLDSDVPLAKAIPLPSFPSDALGSLHQDGIQHAVATLIES